MKEWLRDIRHQKGLTAKQVGLSSGTTESNYAMIEVGTRGIALKVDLAKAIAEVLGFDWTKFYEDVEPRQPKINNK